MHACAGIHCETSVSFLPSIRFVAHLLLSITLNRTDSSEPGGEPIQILRLRVHLREFTTGIFHPQATRPILELGRIRDDNRSLRLTPAIAGPLLFIAQSFNDNQEPSGLAVMVFNWKTGQMIKVS